MNNTKFSPWHLVVDWERLTEKPAELFFSHSIENMSQYLVDTWTANPRIFSFENDLLNKIKILIDKNSIEKQFIEKLIPNLFQQLNELLHTANMNPSKIKEQLEQILQLQQNEKFLEELNYLMVDSLGDSDDDRIRFCMRKLIKFMLHEYTPKKLKGFPREIFARTFFEIHKIEIIEQINSLENKKELFTEWLKPIQKIILEKIQSIEEDTKLDTKLEWMFKSGTYWERETQVLIRNLIQKIIDNQQILDLVSEDNFSEKFKEAVSGIVTQTIKYGLNRTSYCFLVDFLDNTNSLGGATKLYENEYCNAISSIIKNIIYKEEKKEFHEFGFDVSESTFWVFINTFSEIVENRIIDTISDKQYEKLTNLILAEIVSVKSLQSGLESKKLLEQSLYKFNFHYSVQLFLRQLTKSYINEILSIMGSSVVKITDAQIYRIISKSNEELFEQFSDESVFNSLPNGVSKKIMTDLINGLFNELKRIKHRIRVFSLIGGCDLNHKVYRIGDVTFYDARTWDFGEGNQFDLNYNIKISMDRDFKTVYSEPYESFESNGKTYTRKRNSARAYVDIPPVDYDASVMKAHNMIRRALDPLVFAFGNRNRGFRPLVPINFQILNLDTKRIGHQIGPSLETHEELLHIKEENEKIFSFYDQLLTSKTELKESILRSLAWFHRGYWEDLPHEKFVSYWIGLEQLITSTTDGQSIRNKLLEIIPKLVVTWKEVEGVAYSLFIYLRGIINEIKKNPELKPKINQNTAFKNWERHPSILLEDLNYLRSIFAPESNAFQIVQAIEKYLPSNEIVALQNTIRLLQENMKMEIAMLYAKRNQIIHEGLTYDPVVELFCNTLESIFTTTLHRVLQHNYVDNLEQIIYESNRPYQV